MLLYVAIVAMSWLKLTADIIENIAVGKNIKNMYLCRVSSCIMILLRVVVILNYSSFVKKIG